MYLNIEIRSKRSGSHDSFANSSLLSNKPVANDEGRLLRWIGHLPAVRRVVRRWGRTQSLTIKEQLECGIRYFDMRVTIPSCRSLSSSIRVVHALYGAELYRLLNEMNAFLESHPKEVIIIDFNHLYNFNAITYKQLLKSIEIAFNPQKLCPRQDDLRQLSLERMWQNGYQVIVISARERRIPTNAWVWPPKCILSPYPNVNRVYRLLRFLDTTLADHRKYPREIFFVTQGILTPRVRDIGLHLRSSLENYMAKECTKRVTEWIQSYSNTSSFNIIICDFIDSNEFCNTVISLNVR
ncbi:unnamed protein product [Anisakis simplex]|uniref:PLCXc domain-containing protein n=1 Tax=Anisakis simplex TaxID=6269 RepID=A0A0M3JYS6_ANISI|nr:unnamed protein product [Anisakis simplex]